MRKGRHDITGQLVRPVRRVAASHTFVLGWVIGPGLACVHARALLDAEHTLWLFKSFLDCIYLRVNVTLLNADGENLRCSSFIFWCQLMRPDRSETLHFCAMKINNIRNRVLIQWMVPNTAMREKGSCGWGWTNGMCQL